MEAATASDAEPERGYFCLTHIDSGRSDFPLCHYGEVLQRLNQALFHELNHCAHTDLEPMQINQRIENQLTWTMVGHLTTPVAGNHRDISGIEQMLAAASLAERKHPRVLNQPELIRRFRAALIGEIRHAPPDGFVILNAEFAYEQIRPGH